MTRWMPILLMASLLITGCSGVMTSRDPMSWLPYLWTPTDLIHVNYRAQAAGSREALQLQLLADHQRIGTSALNRFGESNMYGEAQTDAVQRVVKIGLFGNAPQRTDGQPYALRLGAGPGQPGDIMIGAAATTPPIAFTGLEAELFPLDPALTPIKQPLSSNYYGYSGSDPFVWSNKQRPGGEFKTEAPGDAGSEFTANAFYTGGKLVGCQDLYQLKLRTFGQQLQQVCKRHLEIYGQLAPTYAEVLQNVALMPWQYEILPLEATEIPQGTGSLVNVGIARQQLDTASYAFVLKYTRTPPGLGEGTLYLRYVVDYRSFRIRSTTVLAPEEFPRAQHLEFSPFLRAWIPTESDLPTVAEIRKPRNGYY